MLVRPRVHLLVAPSSAWAALQHVASRASRSLSTTTTSAAPRENDHGVATTGNDNAAPRRPRTIFSGIQPTGIPHLGNYLGALHNWVELQRTAHSDDTLLFSSVGLHALTMPHDPKTLLRGRREMMATLLAVGLDPQRSIVFQQEDVPDHTYLAWILSCQASFGRLRRITTWKSKIAIASGGGQGTTDPDDDPEGDLNLGLFAYPVLQAADILLYRATHVPVGEDQIQHLELSRVLAKRFNKVYKTRIFPSPMHLITPTARVSSLRDPTQKMSKSAPDPNSRIMLTDTPDQVSAKIKKAVTDSDRNLTYEPDTRPGVATLLEMISALSGSNRTPTQVAEDLNGSTGLVALKAAATQTINQALAPIQIELRRLQNEPEYLDGLAKAGAQRAQARASDTMRQVKTSVGIP